jgi:nucleoside-diphosphate-sugar epimerase
MKNVLVVGNTSMLGRRLISRLSVENQVYSAGRNEKADLFFDLEEGVADLPFDLQCEIIVHCAASFEDDSLAGAIKNERTNSLGALHVADLAARLQCKHLIYVSSISAYSHPENEYFGSYGLSKLHGENNLDLFCGMSNVCFTSLRLSQMYDEVGEARHHQPLFFHIVDKASLGEDITFHGTKDPLRNYVYVEDVATVVERTIARGIGGIFPVVFPESHTLSQTAEIAYEVFQKGGRISFIAEKTDIRSVYIPPVSELYSLIGYKPHTDLRNGISLIRESYEERIAATRIQ